MGNCVWSLSCVTHVSARSRTQRHVRSGHPRIRRPTRASAHRGVALPARIPGSGVDVVHVDARHLLESVMPDLLIADRCLEPFNGLQLAIWNHLGASGRARDHHVCRPRPRRRGGRQAAQSGVCHRPSGEPRLSAGRVARHRRTPPPATAHPTVVPPAGARCRGGDRCAHASDDSRCQLRRRATGAPRRRADPEDVRHIAAKRQRDGHCAPRLDRGLGRWRSGLLRR